MCPSTKKFRFEPRQTCRMASQCYLLRLGHQWPNKRDQKHRRCPGNYVHRNPDFKEISKSVPSSVIDERVGLVADWRRETRACTKHHGHNERARIKAKLGCHTRSDRGQQDSDGVVGDQLRQDRRQSIDECKCSNRWDRRKQRRYLGHRMLHRSLRHEL